MPRSQLFEVDGLNPPRRISKLYLRYRRSIAAVKKNNMPQRLARLSSGWATVNQNHPAATAAAARVLAAGKINGEKSPLLHLVSHPRAPPRHWQTKKLVKFVIIIPALPLRWRPPTMPQLRSVSRSISLT
jgi:hypothetical protein